MARLHKLYRIICIEVATFFSRLWTGLLALRIRKIDDWYWDRGFGFINVYGEQAVFLHASDIVPEPMRNEKLRGRRVLLLGWFGAKQGPRISQAVQIDPFVYFMRYSALVDECWASFCSFLRQTPREETQRLLEAGAGFCGQMLSGLVGGVLAAGLGFYVFDLEPGPALAVVAVAGWWVATRVDYARNQAAAEEFARVVLRNVPRPKQNDLTEPWEGGKHYEATSVWGGDVLRAIKPGTNMPVIIYGMEEDPFEKQAQVLVHWIEEVYPSRFHLHGLLDLGNGRFRQVTGRLSASRTGSAGSLKEAERII